MTTNLKTYYLVVYIIVSLGRLHVGLVFPATPSNIYENICKTCKNVRKSLANVGDLWQFSAILVVVRLILPVQELAAGVPNRVIFADGRVREIFGSARKTSNKF